MYPLDPHHWPLATRLARNTCFWPAPMDDCLPIEPAAHDLLVLNPRPDLLDDSPAPACSTYSVDLP